MAELIEVMDTTLRDGEQMQGVSFSPYEKLNIAKMLLQELRVDRLEIASARVSKGEEEAVKKIVEWAKENGLLERIEILGFVDGSASVEWVKGCGGKTLNLLVKGSLKHLSEQLKKSPEQHFKEISETVVQAKANGFTVNVYLEAWSNGMKESKEYVFSLIKNLAEMKVKRIMLPDTLGILSPDETFSFVKEVVEAFPLEWFDFHAHNDYGLATANTLAAVKAGAKGVHATVNGLGERAGNASLSEVVAAINDKAGLKCKVNENFLVSASRLVETFSGKRISANEPIVGANVFTQTAGVHADGDAKARLYMNSLLPERFGRKREYALGKLSGKASLEQNLAALKMELSKEDKEKVLKRIIQLGDMKKVVTQEDLPYIIADVLETPQEQKAQITACNINSGKGITPKASITLKINRNEFSEESVGDGGYDAFMNALRKAAEKSGFDLAQLTDYEVRIPPGGKTDALVEATITWHSNGRSFKTIGVDSDQLMASVKATEKMLNSVMRDK
ncbi:MAG: alpha-isopropylmalate synthase regulatory domain-containing protein [Candidatus Diapherotrites archaeon]